MYENPIYSSSCQHLSIVCCFHDRHSGRYDIVSHCGFNVDIFISNEMEFLFNMFIGHLDSILYEAFIQTHSSTGLFAFLIWFIGIFCMLYIWVLCQVYPLQISVHFLVCCFIFTCLFWWIEVLNFREVQIIFLILSFGVGIMLSLNNLNILLVHKAIYVFF